MKEWQIVVHVLLRCKLHENDHVVCATVDLTDVEKALESIDIEESEWFVIQEWVKGRKMNERKIK